jgi:putative cardiolipin synthase
MRAFFEHLARGWNRTWNQLGDCIFAITVSPFACLFCNFDKRIPMPYRHLFRPCRNYSHAALFVLAVLMTAACSSLPPKPDAPAIAALPPAQATALDNQCEPLESAHPGASGFVILNEGAKAFAMRAHLTAIAGRSLDVQTYIWHADLTGRYLMHEILQAADRGVRVRLLLDDLDARAKNDPLVALDKHENIEVRLFNPLVSRHGSISAMGDFMASFKRLNHRMHIKNWIVDNRISIAGGRNVGDEYFAASETGNFADLEYMMVGPVVRDGSAEFDRFWNSSVVYPVALLNPELAETADLTALRTTLDGAAVAARASKYAQGLQTAIATRELVREESALHWETDYTLMADDPRKAEKDSGVDPSKVLTTLRPLIEAAQHDVLIVSPYFVPGKEGTAFLVGLVKRGIRVRILTNSLAANDVAAVHGGYADSRKALLKGGVELWELKPTSEKAVEMSYSGSSGASLHAKALSVDGEGLFIGSFNLDPRSAEWNAEMGVYVKQPELAQQFESLFAVGTGSSMAWRVALVDGDLNWTDGTEVFDHEPQASRGRRFQAWLARVLPVNSML